MKREETYSCPPPPVAGRIRDRGFLTYTLLTNAQNIGIMANMGGLK